MPIKFKVFKELNLLYTIFHGWVSKEDAMQYAKDIYESLDFDYALNTLVLLKKSQLVFNIEEVEDFARQIIDNRKFELRRKIAILIESPFDTVAATIYAQTIKNYRSEIEVDLFYILDAALGFLQLTEQKEKIDELILQHSSIVNEE